MHTITYNNGTNKRTQLHTIMTPTNVHNYIKYWHQKWHTITYNNGTNKCAQFHKVMAPTISRNYIQ